MLTERDCLQYLLILYRSFTCLWDTTTADYHNRHVRHEANLKLLKVYQRVVPDADMATMKKRVENMRTTFLREYKKVKKSILDGGNIYQPNLWYFKNLLFLVNEELEGFYEDPSPVNQNVQDLADLMEDTPTSSIDRSLRSRDSNKKSEFKENDEATEIPVVCYDPVAKTIQAKKKFDQHESHNSQNESHNFQIESRSSTSLLDQSGSATENQNQVFGRAIGLQLDELTTTQQFIAQKLISDVIFYGRMKLLSTESCIKVSEEESFERNNKITYLSQNEDSEFVYVNDSLDKVPKDEYINDEIDIPASCNKTKRRKMM